MAINNRKTILDAFNKMVNLMLAEKTLPPDLLLTLQEIKDYIIRNYPGDPEKGIKRSA